MFIDNFLDSSWNDFLALSFISIGIVVDGYYAGAQYSGTSGWYSFLAVSLIIYEDSLKNPFFLSFQLSFRPI